MVCYPVRGNVLELTPPLMVGAIEIDRAVAALSSAIDDAVRGTVTDEQIAPFHGW